MFYYGGSSYPCCSNWNYGYGGYGSNWGFGGGFYNQNYGQGYAIILVLFILLVIVIGSRWVH